MNPIAVARVVVTRAGRSEGTPVLAARGGAELQSDGSLMAGWGPRKGSRFAGPAWVPARSRSKVP